MMKSVAKVFIILSMIFGCILILPIVIGALTLSNMEKAKCKDDMMVWGILCLFFCSIIAGILILCMSEDEFKNPIVGTSNNYDITSSTIVNPSSNNTSTTKTANDNEEVYEKLKELKKLYDSGAIDENIYLAKRQKYIDKL